MCGIDLYHQSLDQNQDNSSEQEGYGEVYARWNIHRPRYNDKRADRIPNIRKLAILEDVNFLELSEPFKIDTDVTEGNGFPPILTI